MGPDSVATMAEESGRRVCPTPNRDEAFPLKNGDMEHVRGVCNMVCDMGLRRSRRAPESPDADHGEKTYRQNVFGEREHSFQPNIGVERHLLCTREGVHAGDESGGTERTDTGSACWADLAMASVTAMAVRAVRPLVSGGVRVRTASTKASIWRT